MLRRVRDFVLLGVLFGWPLGILVFDAIRSGRALDSLLDAHVHELLVNSFVLALTTVIFASVLAVPAALALARSGRGVSAVLEPLAVIPLLIPQHVHTIGWMRVIGRQGMLTQWLARDLHHNLDVRAPWFLNVYPGPAWILACSLFPLIALPLLAGLRSVDAEAIEASRMVASRWVTLRRVLWPMVRPRYLGGAFVVFALSLCAYPCPSLLDTPVLIQRIFFTFSQRDQIDGALLALPLLVMTLVVMFSSRAAEDMLAAPTPSGRQLRGSRHWWLILVAAIPLLLALAPPIVGLVAKIVEDRMLRPETPSPFRIVFARTTDDFLHSFIFTGLGVATLLVCAWPLAYRLARSPNRVLDHGLFSTLALPPLVLGVAVVLAWKRTDDVPVLGWVYRNGIPLVVLALTARFLPIVVRVMRNGFAESPPEQEEAARMAGASRWRRTFRILVPLHFGTLAVGAVVSYVLCFTELDATILTYPPSWSTVQVRIFNMVHYSRDEEVAALCLLSIAAAIVPVVLLGLFSRRRRVAW